MPSKLNAGGSTLELKDTERKSVPTSVLGKSPFAMIVESLRDYTLLALDLNGNILVSSKSAEQLFGYMVSELIGKHISLFYSPADADSCHPQEELKIALAQGQYEEQGWRVRKNGERFWANVVITPIYDKNSKAIGFTKVTRDVSEVQFVETKYRRIFESACEAFIVVNSNGEVTGVNRQAEEMFGYSRHEILGMKVESLMPERFRAVHPGHRSGLMAGDDFPLKDKETRRMMGPDLRLFGLHKNGTEFPVEISLSGLDSREGNLVTCSITDITERVKQEDAVRESEAYFRSLYDHSTSGKFIVTQEAKLVSVNNAFCQLLGYTEEELLAIDSAKLSREHEADENMVRLTRLSREGSQSYTRERAFVKKNGEVVWTILNISIIHGPETSPTHFVGQVQDITELKQAQQDALAHASELKQAYSDTSASEEQFRSIFENTPIGMCLLNPEGEAIRINRAVVDFLGYTHDEILSMSVNDIPRVIHPDYVAAAAAIFENVMAGKAEISRMETQFLHKSGQSIWGLLGVSSIRGHDGNLRFIVVQIMDITARKISDDLIRAQSEDLKRSNDDLLQFANIASHDLQEPLRTITSFVQLLEKRYKSNFDDDGKEWMTYIIEATHRMQHLINDLLAYSRVGIRADHAAPTDLTKIFKAVVSDLRTAIENSSAIVTASDLPVVMADEVQITQLFQNLIGNAIKYCGERAPEVHVSAKRQEDNWIFSVKDNGIGIEKQYFERVFLIFQRLHTREKYEGTGMGLALCKRIVNRHGGKLWVESEPGAGSVFHFTIPANPSA